MSITKKQRPGLVANALVCLLAVGIIASASNSGANCTVPGCTIAEINAWADDVVEIVRGPQYILDVSVGYASHGDPLNILGAASGTPTEAVSLGDGGSVTVRFPEPIYDGVDFDFAVFENGISSGSPLLLFMELGFVEVSSDGVNFARFDAVTSRTTTVFGFEETDPDDYVNFAGNRPAGVGTEFDLLELTNHPLVLSGDVDLNAIEYVRIEDVVGDGSTFDSMSNPVYDPFATPFNTGGFDLDAVGAINVPEPGTSVMLVSGAAGLALLVARRNRLRA